MNKNNNANNFTMSSDELYQGLTPRFARIKDLLEYDDIAETARLNQLNTDGYGSTGRTITLPKLPDYTANAVPVKSSIKGLVWVDTHKSKQQPKMDLSTILEIDSYNTTIELTSARCELYGTNFGPTLRNVRYMVLNNQPSEYIICCYDLTRDISSLVYTGITNGVPVTVHHILADSIETYIFDAVANCKCELFGVYKAESWTTAQLQAMQPERRNKIYAAKSNIRAIRKQYKAVANHLAYESMEEFNELVNEGRLTKQEYAAQQARDQYAFDLHVLETENELPDMDYMKNFLQQWGSMYGYETKTYSDRPQWQMQQDMFNSNKGYAGVNYQAYWYDTQPMTTCIKDNPDHVSKALDTNGDNMRKKAASDDDMTIITNYITVNYLMALDEVETDTDISYTGENILDPEAWFYHDCGYAVSYADEYCPHCDKINNNYIDNRVSESRAAFNKRYKEMMARS